MSTRNGWVGQKWEKRLTSSTKHFPRVPEHQSPTSSIPLAAGAKWLQSCPTLCDPIDGSPPGSSVPGILQAITLEWVAISFSNAWKWKVKLLSRVWLLMTPWTAAYQAPPSMGFSRQEYWSGVPLYGLGNKKCDLRFTVMIWDQSDIRSLISNCAYIFLSIS